MINRFKFLGKIKSDVKSMVKETLMEKEDILEQLNAPLSGLLWYENK